VLSIRRDGQLCSCRGVACGVSSATAAQLIIDYHITVPIFYMYLGFTHIILYIFLFKKKKSKKYTYINIIIINDIIRRSNINVDPYGDGRILISRLISSCARVTAWRARVTPRGAHATPRVCMCDSGGP